MRIIEERQWGKCDETRKIQYRPKKADQGKVNSASFGYSVGHARNALVLRQRKAQARGADGSSVELVCQR